MAKIALLFVECTKNASLAVTLMERLLQELPKESSKAREQLEDCLPELMANKVRHDEEMDKLDWRPNA